MPIFDGTTSHCSGILGSLINWEGDIQFGENEFACVFLLSLSCTWAPPLRSASLPLLVGQFLVEGNFWLGLFGAGLSCLPKEPLRYVNPPPTEPLQQLPKGRIARDTGAIELAHAMIRCF